MATLVVAENINIMSKSVGAAMKERNAEPIADLARRLDAAGADLLDINIGPAKKDGPELMEFVVHTVQEVTDLPLFLDTMNIEAIERGLSVYQPRKGKAVINSIMARPDRMEAMLPLVEKYDCEFIALMYGPDGLPRDENERGELAALLQAEAAMRGMDDSIIWFDPVVVPVNSQQQQLQGCTAFMEMLPMMFPDSKNTCGLSNVSNGAPPTLRALVNRVYLCMLRKFGLHSAIMDGLDETIVAIAGDRYPEMERIVHAVMDGEEPATSNEQEIQWVKTTNMLLGRSLYSDSWLEL